MPTHCFLDTEPQVRDGRKGAARDTLAPLNQASPQLPRQAGANYLGNSPGKKFIQNSMHYLVLFRIYFSIGY